ncbi:unnamed protein product [Danaus chrysippus]|uniref:(African queen) hypothetical protein n=1 Tax=Danaus chrysippus TaxID=151541 RepID=A0A8J2R438_9NEOP|nr:unnamed protein product [Danaus chrysippus]
MASGGHPEGAALVTRHDQLAGSLARLQRLAASRHSALMESVCRHEYLAESAELEEWVAEQQAAASSEDYGQYYEHLLILRSKFEELRHRVESGAERFNQCEELAKKLVASDSPYIADIEKRQEVLGSVTSSRGRHPSAARCRPQLPQAQQQLRAEKEARDDCFQDVLARGQRLLDEERPSSAEIEEHCRAVGGVGAADRLALLPERR